MLKDLLDNTLVIVMVLTFTAVMLLVEGLFLLWRSRHGAEVRRLRDRLEAVASSRILRSLSAVRQDDASGLERAVRQAPGGRILARLLAQADLRWSATGLLLASAACALASWALAVSVFRLPLTLALCGTALGGCAPLAYVQWRRGRRMAALERQLPDALDLITRALRAGHAFSVALKMAGQEMMEPIGSEFRQVHDEVTYGISLPEALTHLGERVPLTDIRFFVVSVLIQRESGGNLTEILSNLSRLVRERLKLLARVRVLSSEGRMSAWILGLMPFGLGALMNLFNPKFMQPLWTDPIGTTIIQWVLAMMVVGILILIRIVRIRV